VSIITIEYLKALPAGSNSTTSCAAVRLWDWETATLRRLQVVIGLAISAAALYLALHDVHWGEVGDAIGDASIGLILLAVILLVGIFGLRAVRWRLLLHSVPGLPLSHVFGCLNVGYFINNVLPFQMGDG
jgi:uncharacterized membrane protein YbhN (UPF0104 family)